MTVETALIALWALVMIGLPIVDWTLGREAMLAAVSLGVLAQAGAVLAILWRAWGPGRALRAAALVALLGWSAEALGAHTGFPFGAYSYTAVLQPQLLSVPMLIPLAWLMMLPPAWAVAQAISRPLAPRWQPGAFVGLSALAMTAWDLFLDPQMAGWGLWQWRTPGGFFGIPWSNYTGWLLVSALITAISRPRDLPVGPLLVVYTITCALQTIGLGVFWAMPGPALVGGLGMGGLALAAWRGLLWRARQKTCAWQDLFM